MDPELVSNLEHLLQSSNRQLATLISERDALVCEQRKALYQSSVEVLHAFNGLADAATVFHKYVVGVKAGGADCSRATTARKAIGEKLEALQHTFTRIGTAFCASRETYDDLALRLNRFHNEEFLTLQRMVIATKIQVDERLRHVTGDVETRQKVVNQYQKSTAELQTKMSLLQEKELRKRKASEGAMISSVVCYAAGLASFALTPIFPPAILAGGALMAGSSASWMTSWGIKIHDKALISKCKKVSAEMAQAKSMRSKAEAQLKDLTDLRHKLHQLAMSSNDLSEKSGGIFESSRDVQILFSADRDRSTFNVLACTDFSAVSELIDIDSDPQQLLDSVREISLNFHQAATAVQERSTIGDTERRTTRALLKRLEFETSLLSSDITVVRSRNWLYFLFIALALGFLFVLMRLR